MKSWSHFFIVLTGSLCLACGINFFLVPFKILDGGVLGIALIGNYLFGGDIATIILFCSLPVFLFVWSRNRDMFYNSVAGILISTLLIEITGPLQYVFLYYVELKPVMSAICGGLLIGSGLGVMLRCNISTGGTDLFAHLLAGHLPLQTAWIIYALDWVIIGIGAWLLPSGDTLILSAISITAGGLATAIAAGHAPHRRLTT